MYIFLKWIVGKYRAAKKEISGIINDIMCVKIYEQPAELRQGMKIKERRSENIY